MSEVPSEESWSSPRYYDGKFSETEQAFSARADHIFEATGAKEWIMGIRAETNGKLDIYATAENIGIPLIMTNHYLSAEKMLADGCITGLDIKDADNPIEIRVRTDLSPDETLLTFGHEVGHLFLEKVANVWEHSWGRNSGVEIFCELFGREMVVSHDELVDVDPVNNAAITELMARYGAGHQTILYGLIMAGKLPTRVILDSEIGVVKNPFYSGKVGRQIICIECELGIPHSNEVDIANTPILDFRGHEWDGHTSVTDCKGRREIAEHIALNKLYGRWTQDDDSLIETETKRHKELTAMLDTYRRTGSIAIGNDTEAFDDDIPF